MLGREPIAQLGHRHIRVLRDMREDHVSISRKPQRQMAALRPGRRVARPPPPQIGLVDERYADREPLRDFAGRLTGVKRRHHLVP